MCDLFFGCRPILTFVGAAFTICETIERSMNRTSSFLIQTSSPEKLIAYELLEDKFDDDEPSSLKNEQDDHQFTR